MVIEIPFRAVTAVPGSENPRRSRGFTIESLIGTDLERNSKRDSVCSQPAHHHPPLPPPPPPPPPPVGHVSSNGTLASPLLPLGTNSLSSSSSSASSPSSSSSSSLSSSSVSPNGNHHPASSSGPVTSSSLTTPSSLPSKNPLKCLVDQTSNHITHHHKNSNSIINSSNYSGSNNNNRSLNNNCTSSSNSGSNTTTIHTNNNHNKINCNKQNSYNSISRSPSPITSHHSEGGRSNSSNSNINSTTTNSNDNNNNINGTNKSDGSPVNSRLVSVAHHYPQQQTPLGLVTHSIEKSLLAEDKERFSHHQHHHSPHSQNQPQNYHHHHHHHSPPVPVSSPVGATGTSGGSPGLHYPLKCVQNTEDYYRGTASGFTPVRLCNHPLGSAVTVAAAAAAAAAAGTAPTWTGVLPPTSPAAAAAAAAAMGPVNMSLYRDHTLFNPWMFARCAGYLGHRYPVNHDGAFLLPPYRKPKRIRTAFSPAQLLQLEEAFEKNHYVVGQERKELAADLKLTETQVKVWFQNRRTKHKRMKAEEEATSGSGGTTREEPTSSSRARSKEMDIDPTGIEPIEYDGSDENSDSEPMGIDT